MIPVVILLVLLVSASLLSSGPTSRFIISVTINIASHAIVGIVTIIVIDIIAMACELLLVILLLL